MNVCELSEEGKIRPVPLDQTDEFTQLFCHIQEEYAARGSATAPAHVVESARAPLLKFFEHGVPPGVTIFSGYPKPQTPVLVKYGQRQFLEPMFRQGDMRFANASMYNQASHLDSVRDDETSRTFFIPTFRERLEGKTYLDFQGHRIDFDDDDITLPLVFADYYLFSLCEQIHYRMPTDFNADCAIVIRDPVLFKQRLISSFLAQMPGWEPLEGRVTYYDPYRDYSKFKVPEMAKHFAYAYQREVRIVMRPRAKLLAPLVPFNLSIGSMEGYADLVPA